MPEMHRDKGVSSSPLLDRRGGTAICRPMRGGGPQSRAQNHPASGRLPEQAARTLRARVRLLGLRSPRPEPSASNTPAYFHTAAAASRRGTNSAVVSAQDPRRLFPCERPTLQATASPESVSGGWNHETHASTRQQMRHNCVTGDLCSAFFVFFRVSRRFLNAIAAVIRGWPWCRTPVGSRWQWCCAPRSSSGSVSQAAPFAQSSAAILLWSPEQTSRHSCCSKGSSRKHHSGIAVPISR